LNHGRYETDTHRLKKAWTSIREEKYLTYLNAS
jgi:hypothetical protein